jgi:VanZ family protein
MTLYKTFHGVLPTLGMKIFDVASKTHALLYLAKAICQVYLSHSLYTGAAEIILAGYFLCHSNASKMLANERHQNTLEGSYRE